MLTNGTSNSRFQTMCLSLLVTSVSILASCVSQVEVPMYRHEFHEEFPTYWLEARINGRTANLLVDTGSSLPAISRDFVERHGFEVSSEQMQNSGLNETSIDVFRPRRFSIGRLRARESIFFVLDTQFASEIAQREVDGIVGGGLFNNNRYSVSFKDNFIKYGAFSIDNINMHPLEVVQQYLYANVAIDGVVDRFLVDSGGLQTQITLELAERILGDLSSLDFSDRVRITVDGRSDVRVAHAVMPSLLFGDVLVEDFPVLVADYTRNIVGIDLLRMGVLTVDPVSSTFGFTLE